MYRFRQPNKPIRASEAYLDMVDDRSVCDVKFDGWRTEIGKFGKVHFFSRTDTTQKVTDEWPDIFDDLLPEGCELDVEWINPTRVKVINTRYNVKLPLLNLMAVFDVRWWDGKYLANTPLSKRRSLPVYSNLPKIGIEEILDTNLKVFQVPSVLGGSSKPFFNLQKLHMISEGVVTKKLNGGLLANWLKVKYRD